MAQPRGKAAPCFSDLALQLMLEGVRRRRDTLFPADGRKCPAAATRKAWAEVAAEVSSRANAPRTWEQCHKRFNDLTRSGKEKRSKNNKERARTGGGPPHVVDPTDAEVEALDLARTPHCLSVADGESVAAETAGPSASPVIEEGDSSEDIAVSESASSHLSQPSTSAETRTSVGPPRQLVGVALGDSPRTSEHEQTLVAGAATEGRRRWEHSSPGSAHLDPDAEPRGPPVKRRAVEGHQIIAEVLGEVPRALSTIAQAMEESNSCMRALVAQAQEGTGDIVSRVGAGASAVEDRLAYLERHAQLHIESVQALTTAVRIQGEQHSAAINRLTDTLGVALQGLTHAIQTVVQQGGRGDVGRGHERDDGERGHGSGDASQGAPTSHPLPPSQPVHAMVPPLQVAESAPAPVQEEQSVEVPSRAPKPRGRPPKASTRSGHEQEQPAATSAGATGVAPRRGSRKRNPKAL
ncbi:myb-related transcription factor, partner of profilin-like [Heptranchias perlo]|uniref:myb-related transcription factor, partner of profilin-like n=1 Tax=Heptranchias perlo TaxID=212740 RepID=UPI00355A88DF